MSYTIMMQNGRYGPALDTEFFCFGNSETEAPSPDPNEFLQDQIQLDLRSLCVNDCID